MVAGARRTEQTVGVHYLDLDGFKPVNDVHGHAAGDEVLCEVARRLASLVRGEDVVARIGGDEFVVLQAAATESAIETFVERLAGAFAASIVLSSGVRVSVGASLGTARFPRDGSDLEVLLRAADAAMYGMKRSKAAGAQGS